VQAELDQTRLLYDRKGAAAQLSISVRGLDRLIASKQLATRRIGKKVLIPRGELVRFSRGNHYEVSLAP
jgi:excisionase family DNA binding protein